jgi:hypothetical protein
MKSIAKWLSFAVLLALGAHFVFHAPLGWSMLVFLVMWLVLGLLVTIDDDLPGGWSNPDGKTPPPWKFREFWGEFLLRAALSAIGFAADAGVDSQQGIVFLVLAIFGSLGGIAIIRSGSYQSAANDG